MHNFNPQATLLQPRKFLIHNRHRVWGGFGLLEEGCTPWRAGLISKVGFVRRDWGSKDFLRALC